MKRVLIFLLISAAANVLPAESWPTYRHDARRSGVSGDSLVFPLTQLWRRESKQPPQTAWTGPAKWDAYSTNSGLQSMRNFDSCFFVTAAGGQVFFGSSVDDAVHALDAGTGQERWVHFTAAAVRLPPTIDSGRAYFGSDDGLVYCCDAESGDLIWKSQAAPVNQRITSNRKIISMWPVRTAVLVRDGRAYFAGSLVPWQDSYLCNVDAGSGNLDSGDGFRKQVSGVTLQGALLASKSRIYMPQGRAAPLAFDLQTGKPLGAIGQAGGVFCVLTEDEMLLSGPNNQRAPSDEIRIANAGSQRLLATFSGTNRILVAGKHAWIPSGGQLKMLDRSLYIEAAIAIDKARAIINNKKLSDESAKTAAIEARQRAINRRESAWQWQVACPAPSGFIKTAGAILVGARDEVRAYSADSGSLIWKAPVDGMAHGLAVAAGRLYVSTGRGHIYAFGASR